MPEKGFQEISNYPLSFSFIEKYFQNNQKKENKVSFQIFYRKSFKTLFLVLFVFAAAAAAQKAQPTPSLIAPMERQMPVAARNNLYCAGFIQKAPVNTSFEIVGAENEQEQFVYSQGQFLYISAGANKGVKVGDMFSVIRPRGKFRSEFSRKGNLGIYVQEVGAVEVIKVKDRVSVARVNTSCNAILLGDLLQPIPQRTSPVFEQRPVLDRFAESTGKKRGRIVLARDGQEMLGREQVVYIDLGAEDNVRVGDYLTVFRPLGEGNLFISDEDEITEARTDGFESEEYKGGKFSIQAPRKQGSNATGDIRTTEEAKENRPKNLRKVVGEIVILNVKERTATAVITRTAQEIHTGDMVELQ